MPSLLDRIRRRTFPPSLDVFDEWKKRLEQQQLTVNANLERVTEALHELRQQRSALALTTAGSADITQRHVLDVLAHIQPSGVIDFEKVRVGSRFDGGYVMLDDFTGVEKALSLGISTNDDWDMDIARRGIPVDQYDYSIEQPPTQHDNIQFFRLKIAGESADGSITLAEIKGESTQTILKCDIEGSEWSVFDATSSEVLDGFSQIVCEFHNLNLLSDIRFYQTVLRVWTKISKTHQSIHVHGNNHGSLYNVLNVPVPEVVEVTFARRRTYKFCRSKSLFPTALDTPNNRESPDIYLGAMRF